MWPLSKASAGVRLPLCCEIGSGSMNADHGRTHADSSGRERPAAERQDVLDISSFFGTRLRPAYRYILALAIFGFALGFRQVALPVEIGLPFVTLFPAVALAVLLCDLGPGLIVLLLSGVVGQYAFMPPFWALKFPQDQLAALATFYVAGLIVCLIVNQMHKARAAMAAALREVRTARNEAVAARNATAATETDLTTILDAVPATIWVTRDPACRTIIGNKTTNELLGLSGGSNVSKSAHDSSGLPFEVFDKGGIAIPADVLPVQRAARGEKVTDYEFELRFKDGRRRILYGNAAPLLDQQGGISGAVAAFIDVTERRQAQRELKKRERRYRALFERSSEGFAICELIRDENGAAVDYRHLEVNPAAGRMVGLVPETILTKTYRELISPINPDWFDACVRAVAGEDVRREEYSPEFERWYASSLFAIGDDRFAVLFSDVTAIKAQEFALAAARAEAERANLAKSKFLAAASHDLRQPVQSLILFLAALKGPTAGTPLEKPVQRMGQAVDALSVMLSGILDVSRLDAGVVTPQLTALDVGAILARLSHEYTALAEAKGLRFSSITPPLHSYADPTLLERILRNLIENAIRYTQRGGVVVACRHRGKSVRVDVVDTGIGIPEEQIGDVFEEYFQLNNSARDRALGLGLGLAIVKRSAKLMGANIEVRSRVGRGSRFSLLLLAAEPCVHESSRPHDATEARGRDSD